MSFRQLGIAAVASVLLASSAWAQATRAPAPAQASRVKVTTLVSGLDHPWAFQFLPTGGMIVTEKDGRMRLVDASGRITGAVSGVPAVVASGQGGLLDVALSPDFATTGLVFFTFSEPRGGGNSGTSVARARLAQSGGEGRLEDLSIILRQKPDYPTPMHFGSRIAFAGDGSLFVAFGERNTGREFGKPMQEAAQSPSNYFGKVIRIMPDGTPQKDTPKRPGWAPGIWSIGHRNVQAIAISPASGNLWTAEHGARGGDEINIPASGKNYGWPVISYGRDYSGSKIGIGTAKAGMEQPIYYWDPSIAPSGMAFYTADLFPAWKGNLFVGALSGSHLARLVLDGERVVAEERLLGGERDRIRDVRQGPDGALYVATDSSRGRILRIAPAE